MKQESYWLDTSPAFGAAQVADVSGKVDVVIVGGGFTGLSSALSLAKSGASVTLFEASQVLSEASGRNGGQCNSGTLQDYLALTKSVGTERARNYYQTFTSAVNTVESLVQSEQIDCGFRRSGKLKLASKPQHFESIIKSYEALKKDVDPDVQLVPKERLRDEIGSDNFHGGMLQPSGAQLHVGKFGVGLADAAAQNGARIFEYTPVSGLEKNPQGRWLVTTDKGSIEAEQVLVATGGSSPGPFNWFRRRIVPVGSFIVVTEPLSEELLTELFPTRRSYVTSKNIGHYFRATDDKRLLFGGRARFAISNPRTDLSSGKILHDSMLEMFPQLQNTSVQYCWGGSVDMSADRLPRAGEHKGLHYSMGYSGHGVQMSVHMGQLMPAIMSGNNDANPWHGLDWPAIPGHLSKPWFLPMVGAYYRIKDILH